MRDYEGWRRLLQGIPLPAAVLDLDAVDHNLQVVLGAMAPGPTVRIASKSLRVPAVLRYLLDRSERVQGLMTFSAHETAWLAGQGFDDLLLAYPIARSDEASALAAAACRAKVRVVVDHVDQARLLSAAAEGAGVELPLVLDVDASWRPAPLSGRAHFGVRRSPIRTADDALRLARALRELPGVRVDGIMAYEAQVAGLSDAAGAGMADRVLAGVKATIKRRSIPLVAARRKAVVEALRKDGFTLSVVNGGGSGSVTSTSRDPSVTEVTAGSGLVCSHLFDGYDGLAWQPALFFALAVVRWSDPDHLTCAGGGYVASGPPGVDRLPKVHLPAGLQPVDLEGFGEVQTPFRRDTEAPALALGDPVICRPAKAGEPAERFGTYRLVRGDVLVEEVPTYRGAGRVFY